MKIGFVVPMGEDPALGRPAPYTRLRDLALRAEAAGLDSVWVYDHLLYRFPDQPPFGIWECWSVLTALAEATERVELGTIVLAAPWRNPALLAKMAITVDEISGGRLILGLGAGWHQPEFDAFGYPFDHRVGRFEEAMQIIGPLLREGKVDFQGQYFSAPDCEMRPFSSRPDGARIPILIASRGPRMLQLTVEHADLWNTAWFGPVEASAERRAEFDAACAAAGRDPATLGITVGVNVAAPGEQSDPDADRNRVLTGTPAEIAAGLRAYADAGVAHVICCALSDPSVDYAATVLDHLAAALTIYRNGGDGG